MNGFGVNIIGLSDVFECIWVFKAEIKLSLRHGTLTSGVALQRKHDASM